jgi:tRNA modification GTPase
MTADADPIFAVASGAGRAAIAVVRMSGEGAGALLARLCGRAPPARRASLRTLRDEGGEVLDRAVVLWCPAPGSYTGEDAAELFLHGGPAVVSGVCEALVAFGARPAEPGEFTRRAFFNGRMDLLEAEAVADLTEAESSAQRRQALRQLDGALGALYRGWAERLTHLCAQQEALIDFPDEALPDGQEAAMLAAMDAVLAEIERHLDDDRRGERLREGLVFAVAGAPNVGKSTLINALVGRDVAIVAPGAGTTRDVLEARAVFGGVPVTLLDTAGLRASDDPIESEGVRRARARAAAADLVVLVRHAADGTSPEMAAVRRLVVASKADLGRHERGADVAVSALTGLGMEALHGRLGAIAQDLTSAVGPPALTRPRHRAALLGVARALRRGREASHPELRGEDFRTALLEFGRITGRIGAEQVLDSVFGQFCIGK